MKYSIMLQILMLHRWQTTGKRSRIFLSDSGCPIGSIFTSHSWIGNFCWNDTISFKNFVETEIACCVLWFPLILTAKFHSLYVKGVGSRKFRKSRNWSRIFYLRLRNPGEYKWFLKMSALVSWKILSSWASTTFQSHFRLAHIDRFYQVTLRYHHGVTV